MQALLKKRDEHVAARRKLIKLPAGLHPQTGEVLEQKKDQDVTDLLLSLCKRLMETESALEVALKSRQSEAPMQLAQTSTSIEGVPLSTTASGPPTG